jgi:5-methyltetrahydrofolate--homocysteine methyltransferase
VQLLKRVAAIKRMNLQTVCGLSNLSFALPRRPLIHRAMLPLLIQAGLDAAIMNVLDQALTQALWAAQALLGEDEELIDYIHRYR